MTASQDYIVEAGGALTGTLRVPGDKSISHRAIMLGALAQGTSRVTGFLEGQDAIATLEAFTHMGVTISPPNAGELSIEGVGLHGLSIDDQQIELDLGNSGTSMRLLCGLLSGQAFDSILIGDSSLAKRPMSRVIDPLARMGAVIGSQEGKLPLHIQGKGKLLSVTYPLPMASAQVKSCLLLAGMYASGTTVVIEPEPTRDHTERMLTAMGYPIVTEGSKISIQAGGQLEAIDIDIPADISSAAFFIVGACIAPDSDLTLHHVGINPTRIGIINILKLMGADITLVDEKMAGNEPVADIHIRYSPLNGIDIPVEQVALAIDEFPAIFIAAACAQGQTRVTGAQELKVKESDRLEMMANGLNQLGIKAIANEQGMVIEGGEMTSGEVDSGGDHRIAMAFAMAGLRAKGPIMIRDCANVATSFPNFIALANRAGLNVVENHD